MHFPVELVGLLHFQNLKVHKDIQNEPDYVALVNKHNCDHQDFEYRTGHISLESVIFMIDVHAEIKLDHQADGKTDAAEYRSESSEGRKAAYDHDYIAGERGQIEPQHPYYKPQTGHKLMIWHNSLILLIFENDKEKQRYRKNDENSFYQQICFSVLIGPFHYSLVPEQLFNVDLFLFWVEVFGIAVCTLHFVAEILSL